MNGNKTKKALLSYEWHVISLIQNFHAFIKTYINTHTHNLRVKCKKPLELNVICWSLKNNKNILGYRFQ